MVQLFGGGLAWVGYMVLGLTSQGDTVLLTDMADSTIKTIITNLNRKVLTINTIHILTNPPP